MPVFPLQELAAAAAAAAAAAEREPTEGGTRDERSVEDLLSFIDGPATDSGKEQGLSKPAYGRGVCLS